MPSITYCLKGRWFTGYELESIVTNVRSCPLLLLDWVGVVRKRLQGERKIGIPQHAKWQAKNIWN